MFSSKLVCTWFTLTLMYIKVYLNTHLRPLNLSTQTFTGTQLCVNLNLLRTIFSIYVHFTWIHRVAVHVTCIAAIVCSTMHSLYYVCIYMYIYVYSIGSHITWIAINVCSIMHILYYLYIYANLCSTTHSLYCYIYMHVCIHTYQIAIHATWNAVHLCFTTRSHYNAYVCIKIYTNVYHTAIHATWIAVHLCSTMRSLCYV